MFNGLKWPTLCSAVFFPPPMKKVLKALHRDWQHIACFPFSEKVRRYKLEALQRGCNRYKNVSLNEQNLECDWTTRLSIIFKGGKLDIWRQLEVGQVGKSALLSVGVNGIAWHEHVQWRTAMRHSVWQNLKKASRAVLCSPFFFLWRIDVSFG